MDYTVIKASSRWSKGTVYHVEWTKSRESRSCFLKSKRKIKWVKELENKNLQNLKNKIESKSFANIQKKIGFAIKLKTK